MRQGGMKALRDYSDFRTQSGVRLVAVIVIAMVIASLIGLSLTGLPTDVIGATTSAKEKLLSPAPDFSRSQPEDSEEQNLSAAPSLPALPVAEVTTVLAPELKIVSVRKGDTLMKALTRAGAPRQEAHEAIIKLDDVFNPRHLKVGQEIRLTLSALPKGDEKNERLLSVHITTDVDREVNVQRSENGFISRKVVFPLDRAYSRASGTIKNSLFLAARRNGVPIDVLMETIRIFSWDVDFQRDVQRNDTFEIFFERFYDKEDRPIKNGNVIFAEMVLSNTKFRFYRHVLQDGTVDYFNQKGQSARKALLRTPVNGARLSSRYGKRRHPILGYSKIHRGLDFAAPRGTPVMAGGDGVIERASRHGAYGKYIRIRHHSGFKTAYAHLSGYARKIRRNKRVRQGQIIGYIGSTGRSTGPHLHYEILKNNRRINPLTLKLPTGRKLKKKALARFTAERDQIDALKATVPLVNNLASVD